MLTRLVMALGLMTLVAGTAHAADSIDSTIPFGFTAGTNDLPAGQYRMAIDWNERLLTVHEQKSGKTIRVPFVTMLSKDAHSTASVARLVFDKVGDDSYFLSEVWWPGADGILVGAAKGKHEHKVIEVKK